MTINLTQLPFGEADPARGTLRAERWTYLGARQINAPGSPIACCDAFLDEREAPQFGALGLSARLDTGTVLDLGVVRDSAGQVRGVSGPLRPLYADALDRRVVVWAMLAAQTRHIRGFPQRPRDCRRGLQMWTHCGARIGADGERGARLVGESGLCIRLAYTLPCEIGAGVELAIERVGAQRVRLLSTPRICCEPRQDDTRIVGWEAAEQRALAAAAQRAAAAA